MTWGKLQPFRKASFPVFPGMLAALGPGIVWMALAQGSGELIWWPYTVAKYGLGFLFLLAPACLLQYPLNYHIGHYTLVTGESIFQGFIRLNRLFALGLWALMAVSFLWFGAFASAGGTALAELTHFPAHWGVRGQTLFWAYASITIFLAAIFLSRIIYVVIEKFMMAVALITLVGLVWACLNHEVLSKTPAFLKAIFVPQRPLPRPWDPDDATKLLTAITFAGLGGFWTLFYSYWLREKGAGMAHHMGHITGLIPGKTEVIPEAGFVCEGTAQDVTQWKRWRRFLLADSSMGIIGNLLTTFMTCLLAYALLFPKGLLPSEYQLAVVQSRFFEVSWGIVGRIIFLIVAAAFLSDTWLATVDAVSRIHTDFFHNYFPAAKKISVRSWYFICLVALTVITSATVVLEAPGPLILLSAVIGFIGTLIFSAALLFLNYRILPKFVPQAMCPGRFAFLLQFLACAAYAFLAALYLWQKGRYL